MGMARKNLSIRKEIWDAVVDLLSEREELRGMKPTQFIELAILQLISRYREAIAEGKIPRFRKVEVWQIVDEDGKVIRTLAF